MGGHLTALTFPVPRIRKLAARERVGVRHSSLAIALVLQPLASVRLTGSPRV